MALQNVCAIMKCAHFPSTLPLPGTGIDNTPKPLALGVSLPHLSCELVYDLGVRCTTLQCHPYILMVCLNPRALPWLARV